MLRLAQQKEREGAGIPGWRMLVTGKGLGEDVTNGAAARQSPLAQSPPPGRKSKEERVREREERFKKQTEEMDLFCSCFYGARR